MPYPEQARPQMIRDQLNAVWDDCETIIYDIWYDPGDSPNAIDGPCGDMARQLSHSHWLVRGHEGAMEVFRDSDLFRHTLKERPMPPDDPE